MNKKSEEIRKKEFIGFRADETERESVQVYCESNNITISNFFREIIKEYLSKRKTIKEEKRYYLFSMNYDNRFGKFLNSD